RTTAVSPGRQVQQRPEWTIDQRGRLIDRKVAHVPLAQLEFDTALGCADAGLLKHGGRAIDADDWPADRSGDRNSHAAISYRELYHGPVGVASELDIETDIGGHVRRPFLVPRRERFRPARPPPPLVASPPSSPRPPPPPGLVAD